MTGRAAWICGASRGIGKAIARRLADEGVQLTLIARNEAALAEVLEQLPNPARHRYAALDLSAPGLASRLTELLQAGPAPLLLVNNTGGPAPGLIQEASAAQFEVALRGHLIAAQTLTQTVLPGMRAAGYGRIVNILSTSVRQPIPGLGVSNTIRAAMASWAKTLAFELAAEGITVNNLLPGYTQTERLEAIIASRADKSGFEPQAVIRQMLEEVPMRRFASPEEIAAVASFLLSEAAGYITGVSLPVDGGRIQAL